MLPVSDAAADLTRPEARFAPLPIGGADLTEPALRTRHLDSRFYNPLGRSTHKLGGAPKPPVLRLNGEVCSAQGGVPPQRVYGPTLKPAQMGQVTVSTRKASRGDQIIECTQAHPEPVTFQLRLRFSRFAEVDHPGLHCPRQDRPRRQNTRFSDPFARDPPEHPSMLIRTLACPVRPLQGLDLRNAGCSLDLFVARATPQAPPAGGAGSDPIPGPDFPTHRACAA